MKKIKFIILVLIISFQVSAQKSDKEITKNNIQNEIKFPVKGGFVNDFEKIFTNQQKSDLKTIVENYKKNSGREIYIITTSEMYGFDNLDALIDAFIQKWDIWKLPKKNWLIIFLSKKNRELKINAGFEASKYITDKKINEVIGTKVISKLRENNFFGGIKNAVDELIIIWN